MLQGNYISKCLSLREQEMLECMKRSKDMMNGIAAPDHKRYQQELKLCVCIGAFPSVISSWLVKFIETLFPNTFLYFQYLEDSILDRKSTRPVYAV